MTLYEMSFTYEKSAELLRNRLAELRTAAAHTEDENERLNCRTRIAALEPIYREMRRLTAYTRFYYGREQNKV